MKKNRKAPAGAATPTEAAGNLSRVLPASIVPQKAESVLIRIPEAMEILQCSRSTAQRCFAAVNAKLKKQGKFVISGRCNRRAFYEAIGLGANE